MPTQPEPLSAGAVLGERFEILRMIGRGGFGIAYLAKDFTRGDEVVVKELAPEGSVRDDAGMLDLESIGPAAAQRLRRCFLDEARLLARLNIAGVVNVRTYGAEDGSAYYVTDYFADAEPLDALLRRTHRLSVEGALDIGFQLIETLEGVHRRGILHRDIKPANVLVRKNGQTVLIDFGAAREWHADMTEHHTVLFTPGYAPIEQLSERAKRGPATDVYGLAALIYTLITGFPPTPSTDRMNGVPLTPLQSVRPEVDPAVSHAIEIGLALHYSERPQTVAEFRENFSDSEALPDPSTLEALDAKLVAVRRLSFGKRQCPSCGDVLQVATPLPRGRCPVCNRGAIKPRPIHSSVCPACRLGILHETPNSNPLSVCPLCSKGLLARRRAKLLSKEFVYECGSCDALFEEHDKLVKLARSETRTDLQDESQTWEEWSQLTRRGKLVEVCDGCHAQFDHLPDGQWQQIEPPPPIGAPVRLYPEEWARVAAGLDPGCGTHVCLACEADYFVDDERVTLLGAHEDPYHFAEANIGRPLSWEALRWLGVGKSSENPGPSCPSCGTEFDSEGEYLRLVRSNFRPLQPYLYTLQTFTDWHRIAHGLPRVHEQAEFERSLDDAILTAFNDGELVFDDRGTIWKSQATRLADGVTGTLQITPAEITFGGLLRKDKMPLELLASAQAEGEVLTLQRRGSAEPLEYEIVEAELTVPLESGERIVSLDAQDLATRLLSAIGKQRTVGTS